MAYSNKENAHEGPGGADFQLPAGEYVVKAQYRNESQWHDPDLDDGYYYFLRGDEVSGYVRQNELRGAMLGKR